MFPPRYVGRIFEEKNKIPGIYHAQFDMNSPSTPQDNLSTFSRVFDGHFLLYERRFYSNSTPNIDDRLFGIDDLDNPEEVDRRLYKKAMKFLDGYKREDIL